MNARLLETHGDPLGTIRSLIYDLWQQANLDGILLPTQDFPSAKAKPEIIDQPEALEDFNPFKPVMSENSARLLVEERRRSPDLTFAAVLRPCETRALHEMLKRDHFDLDRAFIVCVDCLGTFPLEEYEWRLARKGSIDRLAQEALQFAHQGGILAYRYRPACQLCSSPEAQGSDLNLSVIGLPVRQYLLVSVSDRLAERGFIPGKTDPESTLEWLLGQHQRALAKLAERNNRTRERIEASLGGLLPENLEELLDHFQACGGCEKCMAVCPICYVDYPRRDPDQRYRREDIARWLISCAGCGMCEQACPQNQPLSAIFGHVKARLIEELRL